jgi:hypothetical protein
MVVEPVIDIILHVLDWVLRGLGVLVLFAGLVLLVLALTQPDPDDDLIDEVLVPLEVLTDKQRVSIEMARGMGFKTRFDYANFGGGIKERLGQCYMLTGKAMLDRAAYCIPAPAAVIHGSWHGPTSENRIDHAVVLLDNGKIWEPVTAGIFDREQFESYTRWERHQIYSAAEARDLMNLTGHYGPW